jgi:hypothetical protein
MSDFRDFNMCEVQINKCTRLLPESGGRFSKLPAFVDCPPNLNLLYLYNVVKLRQQLNSKSAYT